MGCSMQATIMPRNRHRNTMRRLFALYCVVMAEAAMHSGGTATFIPPSDPQRPLVHFTPPQGWMNDPSKPIEDTRKSALYRYHLYFQVFNSTRPVLPTVTNSRLRQWTPNSTKASWQGGWGPFWGHAVSQSIAGPWKTLGFINIGKQSKVLT